MAHAITHGARKPPGPKLVLDKKIDLVDLPQIGKEVYRSAKQTIVENIVKFDNDEYADTEDLAPGLNC